MTSVAAGSHPRVAARRASVEESDERRKWRRTLGIVGLLAVVAAGLALARSPLADVDTVTVDTGSRVDAALVVELSGIESGVPLIDVDLGGVEERVARHPWVASAEASRRWPDTLHIDITERVPVAASPTTAAALDGDGWWRLVDLEGRVLALAPTRQGLPLVIGPETAAAPGQVDAGVVDAVMVADALPADLDAWVDAVVTDETGDLSLLLRGSVPVRLGSTDQMADKLVAVATLITRVQRDCIESFDVQAPDAPVAVRCEVAPG